jgi:hypothetical protein
LHAWLDRGSTHGLLGNVWCVGFPSRGIASCTFFEYSGLTNEVDIFLCQCRVACRLLGSRGDCTVLRRMSQIDWIEIFLRMFLNHLLGVVRMFGRRLTLHGTAVNRLISFRCNMQVCGPRSSRWIFVGI